MEPASHRLNESFVLDSLRHLHILDSDREPEFDAVVCVAAQVCGTPISLVSLVDAERQWFKAEIGMHGVSETPREIAFCAHAVLGSSILEVPDATKDSRFVDNLLVESGPKIRFYAGAPIVLSDGSSVGTVCVIDVVPRQLTDSQRDILTKLATVVVQLLEGRKAVLRSIETTREAQRALSVLRHCSDAVLGMTLQLDITCANPSAEALLGRTNHELIGTRYEKFVPADAMLAFQDALQQAKIGKSYPHDTQRHSHSGVRLDVTELLTKKTNAQGEVVGFMAFVRDIGQRLAAADALAKKESEQRFIFEHLVTGVFIHGPDGALLKSNPRGAHLLGLSEEVMSGKQVTDPGWHFIRLDGTRMAVAEYPVARVMASLDEVHDLILGVVSPYSQRRTWLMCYASREYPEAPALSRIIVSVVDVTRLIEVERNLEFSQRALKDLFENAQDPILMGKPDGTITAANPAACRALGMDAEEVCRIGREGILDRQDPGFVAFTLEREKQGLAQGELQMIRKCGERFIAELSSTIYKTESGELVSSIFFRDISARKATEKLTTQLTYFDDLTGLPNRRYLLEQLRQSLAAAVRHKRVGGLVFIDLDNFKQVNDARGHLVGDELLKSVAIRLRDCLRINDTLARLGGDEFIVLIDDLDSDFSQAAHYAARTAEKCREALSRVFEVDHHTYKTTGSFGITLFPREGQAADDVLREADTAMYRAKSLGRDRIAFFGPSMQAEVESRLLLEFDLSEAIVKGQLKVFVQPQFSADGRLVGGELLLRWQHPIRGDVPPSEFIPVAESTGLILVIGDWVLQQAVDVLKQLQVIDPELSLSVNVSPRQFLQDQFVLNLCSVLDAAGVPGSSMILEVTEGLLIQDWDEVQNRFSELMRKQIRLSIDDFGTGYSSLAYLKRLPLYELKIDRGFVADIPQDRNDVAIVGSIISIAKHLGFKVVAEGVETPEQVAFLLSHGCDVLQGYLFARPMPVIDWLDDLSRIAATVTALVHRDENGLLNSVFGQLGGYDLGQVPPESQ